ncbi:MAG: HRDC domain-containing protein [Deltaproteobacteria bacterium]|nr:HRDC domain-containing protein [Deltaproteobacteria bacterium]
MHAHTLIVDDAGLAPLAEALASTSELALDTESNSMFAYRERLCLVQLALPRPDGDPLLAVIDPLAFPSTAAALAPLAAWLADPAHRVLLHGGEYDVAILKRELGVSPARVFDTQAAAMMLGIERTGFGSLVEIFCDVTLAKSHQQHDWKRRPIPQAALAYALDDVAYLVPLARRLEAIVAEADLVEEVDIACAAVAAARPHAPRDPGEAFWRVIGAARPSEEDLARLFALWRWRESLAEARDVPPARLVPNEVLHRVAARRPTSAADLEGLGLPRDVVQRACQPLIDLFATPLAALDRPPARARSARPDPQVRARESRLKRWREDEARQRGVSPQVVLPARALEHLATHGLGGLETAPQLGPKRLARYGEALRALIE